MNAPEPSEHLPKSPTVDIQWIAEPVGLDASDGEVLQVHFLVPSGRRPADFLPGD